MSYSTQAMKGERVRCKFSDFCAFLSVARTCMAGISTER
jgi:hypothetical protein